MRPRRRRALHSHLGRGRSVRRRRALGRLALVAAVVGIGLANGVAAAEAAPGATKPSGSSPDCGVPAHLAKGKIVVPLVVDFGGRHGRVLVTCMVTAPGLNGEQLLDEQAARLAYPQPSYCTSGLLWTIDGYPSTGCPANPGGDNAYWAYWHGGKTWTYAAVGPGGWKVSRGDVEGWRYEPDGKANAPRAPSNAAALEVRAAATSGNGAGPRRPSGGSGTGALPFVVGAAIVLVLGAAALVRTRRAHLRSA
jgi:hypothetical protein